MYYILDGYNIIYALGLDSLGLEASRRALLIRLIDFIGSQPLRISVVFDAHSAPGNISRVRFDAIEVVYTHEKQTADEYIIEFLEFKKHPKSYSVVTDDCGLKSRVQFLGAKIVNCSDFIKFLKKKNKNTNTKDKNTEIFDKDFSRYLDIFEKKIKKEPY